MGGRGANQYSGRALRSATGASVAVGAAIGYDPNAGVDVCTPLSGDVVEVGEVDWIAGADEHAARAAERSRAGIRREVGMGC
jgi:hypothetical protein